MEYLVLFLLIVGLLALLDLAALRWGVSSRRNTGDWTARPNFEYYDETRMKYN